MDRPSDVHGHSSGSSVDRPSDVHGHSSGSSMDRPSDVHGHSSGSSMTGLQMFMVIVVAAVWQAFRCSWS